MLQTADEAAMQAFLAQNGNGGQAERLIATFYTEAVQDEAESVVQGRFVAREQEFIEIRVPGDKDEIRRRPVRASDKRRFPQQYAAFKANAEQAAIGTPLEKLPFLTKAQVLEFKAANCTTAEHVRDMPDSLAQRFMGSNAIRARVKDFLDAAAGAAPAIKLRAELEQRDGEIAALKKMLEEQSARIDAIGKVPKK